METSEAITVHGGATVNGVQTDTEIIMARKGFDKWPSAKDGLKMWEDKVKGMDLVDVKDLPIRNLGMNAKTGGLFNIVKDHNAALPATKTALGHLMSYVKDKPSNALGVMLDLPVALRAQMFTEYMNRPEPRNVVLRTAVAPGTDKRVIRAVVSEVHSQEKGDDLSIIESLRTIVQDVPTAKLRVIRQWDYTHAELVIPNVAVQPKVGVTLYGRISLLNSETKGGSYISEGGSFNLVCLNGMVRPGNTSEYRVRHMGDISFRVRQSIRGAVEAVSEHLQVFNAAYRTPLERPRADILAAFGAKHELPENTVHAIGTLWDVDGERSAGDTLAGLVNAVTRYAQSQPVERALELESVAGETLHKGLSALI